jgi:hypothetical protein
VVPEDLTEPERALWAAFPRGAELDLRAGVAEVDDVSGGAGWGPERTVRAEVIQALLLGAVPPEPGQVAALRLIGARVTGRLRLAYADIACPVRLNLCHLGDRMDLYGARVRQLNLNGSALPGLDATVAVIAGDIRLNDVRCDGEVRLTGTRVAGAVRLREARLTNPGGVALLANRLDVGDDLLLRGAVVDGEVRLAGARIGGMLDLNGARLANPGGRALTAFRLLVGAYLRGRHGFTADGEVTLTESAVTGSVDLAGAQLRNPGADALAALGISVGGALDLCDGFRSEGTLRLMGARVTGPVCLRRAELVNPGQVALDFRHAQARELDLRLAARTDSTLDLRHARVNVIHDEPASWPVRLRLDGLSYTALARPLTAEHRLAWLARDSYLPYAYEQLAASYRRSGDEAQARTVLLAKQRQHHRHRGPGTRIWGQLQDSTVGYGYRPLRAAGWLLLLLAAGTAVFATHHPVPAGDGTPPGFNPLVYSLDLLLPIIDFGQEHAYTPQGWQRWVAYLLIATGWLLASTVTAGLTRTLTRN